MPTTTRSPTPTTCSPARSTGCERQRRSTTPALLYVSDHGESLGENNLYLHGLPYALRAARAEARADDRLAGAAGAGARRHRRSACLRERRDAPLSHDNLFHTVLGQLGVATQAYRRELDAFAPCRVALA